MRIRIVPIVALAAALAGCAGPAADPQVATAAGTGAPPGASAPAQPLSEKEQGLKFSQCIRDNGVPNFPDPEFHDGGGVSLGAPEGISKEKLDAAMQACRQYAPGGGGKQKLDPARLEQLRKLAQCMRAEGVENFPDPTDEGIQADGNAPGMSLDDPKFQAAMKTCDKYAPAPPGEGPSTHREG
ncbi:hypothetical protein [Catellatospora vulcania]|uniref:hypothetical protein n=1 Tax=Catellatospora vulcania TaxID=1460450 RepID=UPI0012D4B43F|nr:hypothetical protein [Catellatospora vulcania]